MRKQPRHWFICLKMSSPKKMRDTSKSRQTRRAAVEMDAYDRQSLLFGRRSAGRREAAELAAGSQHAVTRDDDRYRVLTHRGADVAGGFGTFQAEAFCQRAIGSGGTEADRAQRL